MKSDTNVKNIQLKKSQMKIGGEKATNLLINIVLDEKITIFYRSGHYLLYFIELIII